MENLLFLTHRIPFPPNKGDKIRSYHFLKALTTRYRVFLGTFIDDPEDWRYEASVKSLCQDSCVLALNPLRSKIKSLTGLLNGKALSLPYYQNQAMQRWVDRVISQQDIKKTVIFSSVMAQYVMNKPSLTMIADFVDVDSDKWRQYALTKKWPENWIYRRESRQLLNFEKQVVNRAGSGIFVSAHEAELFQRLAPEFTEKIKAVNNGVDTVYFSPDQPFSSPYRQHERVMVFTGAMDYWANVDAVKWFAEAVFPAILRHNEAARFYIVGSKPAREVLALAERPGVVVTGKVDDVRPYITAADLVVAPLRIARGIQNKVLEAMSMAKMIVATSAAIEGVPVTEPLDLAIADAPEQFADEVCRRLNSGAPVTRSQHNRNFVLERFSWQSSGERLLHLIESSV